MSYISIGIFSMLFATALYVQAATASISESYLRGINSLRWFDPTLIFLAGYLATWIIARFRLIYPLIFAGVAFLICILVAIIIYIEPQFSPSIEAVDFTTTLQKSLLTPSFSNRSSVVIMFLTGITGLAASVTFLGLLWKSRRAQQDAAANP